MALDPKHLKYQIELGGQPRIIAVLCELNLRIRLLELRIARLESETASAPAATSTGTEIVEDLGHGWQIVRTPNREAE